MKRKEIAVIIAGTLIIAVTLWLITITDSMAKPMPHMQCEWIYDIPGERMTTSCGNVMMDGCPYCGRKIELKISK